MHQAHIKGKMRNRLNRLRRKIKGAGAGKDRQSVMEERMRVIELALR